MYRTILLAFDGSDHAMRALDAAVELAARFEARLHLAHTPQLEVPAPVIGGFVAEIEGAPTEEDYAEAGRRVAEEAEARAGLEFEGIHIGRGDPAEHVLAVAERIGADLIVMGRRGVSAARALLLGSVSLKVAHGARCACLTVP
jgi:nucleotide-binding universal stress UspA family protein